MRDFPIDIDFWVITFNWVIFALQVAGSLLGALYLFTRKAGVKRRSVKVVTQVSVIGMAGFLILEFWIGGFLGIKPVHFRVGDLTGSFESGWIETVTPQTAFSSRDLWDDVSNRFAIITKKRSGDSIFDERMMQRLMDHLRETAADGLNSSGKFREAQVVFCELQTWNGVRGVRLASRGTLVEGNIENCAFDQFVVMTRTDIYYLTYLSDSTGEKTSGSVLDSILRTLAIED